MAMGPESSLGIRLPLQGDIDVSMYCSSVADHAGQWLRAAVQFLAVDGRLLPHHARRGRPALAGLVRASVIDRGATLSLQWPAMACNGLQWPAMACNGLQWPAMACNGLQWPAMACNGLQWPVIGLAVATPLASQACGVA